MISERDIYEIRKRQSVQRQFLDDPIGNAIVKEMASLTVFQTTAFIMKDDGEIVSAEKKWNNKQAEALYLRYQEVLKEYSENLLKQLNQPYPLISP